jgi:nitrogen fixation/metabolism regulation signal transduction histidine kinase
MSKSDDRGWNIVANKARTWWVAKLLGASRDGESSIYTILLVILGLIILLTAVWGCGKR